MSLCPVFLMNRVFRLKLLYQFRVTVWYFPKNDCVMFLYEYLILNLTGFYSTDQLPPIKQEIQETDERTTGMDEPKCEMIHCFIQLFKNTYFFLIFLTVEDSNENLNMDTGSEEQEVVHLGE